MTEYLANAMGVTFDEVQNIRNLVRAAFLVVDKLDDLEDTAAAAELLRAVEDRLDDLFTILHEANNAAARAEVIRGHADAQH